MRAQQIDALKLERTTILKELEKIRAAHGVKAYESSARDYLIRLIKHTAILNLGIDGNQRARDEANESWRSLPDDLTSTIHTAEQVLLNEWAGPVKNEFINQRFNKVD